MTLMFVALAAALLFIAGEAAYAQWLTRYRTDIEEGTPFWRGQSWAFQRNVYRRENYEPEGRKRLWQLYVLRGMQVLAALAFLLSLFYGSGPGLFP